MFKDTSDGLRISEPTREPTGWWRAVGYDRHDPENIRTWYCATEDTKHGAAVALCAYLRARRANRASVVE